MVEYQEQLKVQEAYVKQLLMQVTADYKGLKSELKQVAEQYPGSDDEFSFVEELDLWISNISGYAEQVQSTGSIRQLDAVVIHLKQLQLSRYLVFMRFYADNKEQYPRVKSYLQSMDYLRLLTLEHSQILRTVQPISA